MHRASSFSTNLMENELSVYVDKIQMRRVFENIIQNALDAVDDVGRITISTERDNKEIVIRIVDDGIGMDESVQEKLYTAHFSTKESGVGLGLVNVKRIIEDFNGGIKIQSAPGKGTTVELRLPESYH